MQTAKISSELIKWLSIIAIKGGFYQQRLLFRGYKASILFSHNYNIKKYFQKYLKTALDLHQHLFFLLGLAEILAENRQLFKYSVKKSP